MFGMNLGGLGAGGHRGAGGALPPVVFSPADLFLNGEQGAWYDPSDLSTMFQDSAGTTPVTADGQPVGLILDKSQGLVLGPEIVTNGTFDTNTGWTNQEAVITGGKLVCSATTAWAEVARQSAAAPIPGGTYKVLITVSNYVSGALDAGISVGASANITVSGNGSFDGYMTLTGTGYDIRIQATAGGFIGDVDDYSIKLVAGNHASQSTSTARPLYKTDGTYHWLQFDGIDDLLKSSAFSMSQPLTYTIGSKAISWASNRYWYDGITVDKVMMYQIGASPQVKPYAGVVPSGVLNIPNGSPCVVSNIYNGASSVSRLNAAQVLAETFGTSGTDGITIGGNGGGTGKIDANVYSLIARGALSTPEEITETEAWVNGKTGAY